MQSVSPTILLDNLGWRYATKKFDATKKISSEDWRTLEQSLLLAPSSFGLQPWKFFVINDAALRQTLRPASWNQSQITDASHLVVFARRSEMTKADIERYIQRVIDVRGTPAEALLDYKNMMLGFVSRLSAGETAEWAAKQCYIALGFFLATAAQLRVDACPMEGIDAAQYDTILGLKAQGYTTVVTAAAGYRAGDDWLANLKKVRFESSEVIERR
jgi:nitroreductase